MAYTIDRALSDPLITVVSRNDDMGEYAIQIGSLQTVVIINLGRFRADDRTKFTRSHAIHTPSQIDAYWPSITFKDYWAEALHEAITSLTMYHSMAVKAGHSPAETWLVKG